MSRAMVTIRLYRDGTYTLEDTDSSRATQRMFGFDEKGEHDVYVCPKSNWKKYLLKLLSNNHIDKQIAELKKAKKKMEETKAKILREIENE